MISIKRKNISRIEMNDEDGIKRSVVKIYTIIDGEIKVLWEAIRSCFGSGSWLQSRPWINNNAWKNN